MDGSASKEVFDDTVRLPDEITEEQMASLLDAYRSAAMSPREIEKKARLLGADGRVNDGPDVWTVLVALGIIMYACATAYALKGMVFETAVTSVLGLLTLGPGGSVRIIRG